VLAWTTLLLLAPGALWLWTKCRPAGSRSFPRRALETQRDRQPNQATAEPSPERAPGSTGTDGR
jgi:hypothetical protein